MGKYNKVLRHVDMNRVKQLHEEKIERKKLIEKEKELIREELKNFNSPEFSNWRWELEEGMTSSGLFQTTLPATGDTDLVNFDLTNQSNYLTGDNVSYDGGLSFNSYGGVSYAITNPIDTSTSDTISFIAYAGPNSSTQNPLIISYYNNDTGAYGDLNTPNIKITPNGYNITLPPEARGENVDFLFLHQGISGEEPSESIVGQSFSISGESIEITDGNYEVISNLLSNYDGNNGIFWGQQIMSAISRNDSSYRYPGFVGPVSGNVGDPEIYGFNGDLEVIQYEGRSIAFINGFLSNDTLEELIDRFSNTDLDVSSLYYELRSWDSLTDDRSYYYGQYIINDGYYPVVANYYLNLYNQTVQLVDEKETEIYSIINSASAFPDSEWTNADFEKVAENIYNLFSNDEIVSDPTLAYTIKNFSTRRKTPITVFVPLDSPEAASFIRTDPIMANLSPEERKKKLQDMLEASDEYLEKIFGEGFPGTGLDPAVGEAGDTPGVEIAGVGPYGPGNPPPGPAPGPNYVWDKHMGGWVPSMGGTGKGAIDKWEMTPQPNIPKVQNSPMGQDTQVAAGGNPRNTGGSSSGDPGNIQWPRNNYPNKKAPPGPGYRPPTAQKKQKTMVAHHEPQGNLITERKKKLKSPEEVLNKIPGYYDGKPAPLGFPVEQPPKMKNGMHPDLVDGKKVADRFNRLDPISAKAMPLTGNPHIDKKVKTAQKKPK